MNPKKRLKKKKKDINSKGKSTEGIVFGLCLCKSFGDGRSRFDLQRRTKKHTRKLCQVENKQIYLTKLISVHVDRIFLIFFYRIVLSIQFFFKKKFEFCMKINLLYHVIYIYIFYTHLNFFYLK